MRLGPFILFFASGFTSLVYEVLWLRQLGVLLGNTAHAAAITLTVFLAGLATGAEIWGRRPATLCTYARLELGVAVTALAHFALIDGWSVVYPAVVTWAGDVPAVLAIVKAGLAFIVLFPTAVLIGGTLPVMVRHQVRERSELGRTGSLLYAVNTIGAACGCVAAGFLLPRVLGFQGSYLAAITVNLFIAIAAWALSRAAHETSEATIAPVDGDAAAAVPGAIAALAFVSGFCVLALEVLWTRMFAQVLHNSVYSFSAVLGALLVALALGALVARVLCRLPQRFESVLGTLLVAAGIAVALTPHVFVALTDGLAKLGGDHSWGGYVATIFATVALVTAAPAVLCGAVFPYLLRICQERDVLVERAVGRLAAVNTVGAISGLLAAGFVLLGTVGLWGSMRAIAVLYLLSAVVLLESGGAARALRATAIVVLFSVSFLHPSGLPTLQLNPLKDESLLESWQGASGIVAVVRRKDDLRIKVDNHYSLGGSAGRAFEGAQADLPLALAPRARSVYFLGVGTGITAGAALRHPVEKVTAVELIPEVLMASRKYFAPYTNGLFDDARVTIVVGDGRQHLAARSERYDVIVSDLFVPWQAGAGSLYTREHFTTVRARLAEGGLFAQWLPLYQVSEREFAIIARTMLEVFPQVTLWRGDFLPDHPIVALVGQGSDAHLDPSRLVANVRRIKGSEDMDERDAIAFTALTYGGNLTLNDDLFRSAAVNTDDRPVLEYLAPRTEREAGAGRTTWFTLGELDAFYTRLFARVPPEHDPYLRALNPEHVGFVRGGAALYRAFTQQHEGRGNDSRELVKQFTDAVPYAVHAAFSERIALLR